MGQAGQQQHSLLRLPPALPAGHQPQRLLVRAEGRFAHGPAVIGIGHSQRLKVGPGGHEHRLLVPALLLGRADHPLPRGSAKAVGTADGRHLPARARRRMPGAKPLSSLPSPSAVPDLRDHLRAPAAAPMEPHGGPKAAVQAAHHP
jgi:hypothetical protein